ncbi:peptidylprolyl isomerase [Zeaxanthinibacter sp. PT1]|uniref:peptidylprolyl isomerase n=1 Tax=Zeaxanthinibacter TaxID=561554 RepID=UPI00234BDAE0|nr:peptidylprolyl isomerase [Zeaxanthinibacter sp. PT1]MDC6350920.1 peptidylprolyl isomerase [Zeaxanthinibacter sp. PT1]
MRTLLLHIVLCLFLAISCKENKQPEEPIAKDIEIVTTQGSIILRLYDETSLHRDNFIKLVNDDFYDSILFHRVIENFVIQAGDPESKNAAANDSLGEVDLPYTVPAEFHPDIFHKRGALGMARNNSPSRASSSTQFYIVQGQVYNDSLLKIAEDRINSRLAFNQVVNNPANKELSDTWAGLEADKTSPEQLAKVIVKLDSLALITKDSMKRYSIPEDQWDMYTTEGGAAHLDQSYSVFGEVVSGMEVVDHIAAVETNPKDRPLDDVRIKEVRFIDRKEYTAADE